MNLDGTSTADKKGKLIKEFCEYTSFGGLGRVVGAKQLAHKVAWLLLFLGAFVYAGAQLHVLYTKHQSRPIQTKIKIMTEKTLPFPTVTFCNFNAVRKSKISELPTSIKHMLTDFTHPHKTYEDLWDKYGTYGWGKEPEELETPEQEPWDQSSVNNNVQSSVLTNQTVAALLPSGHFTLNTTPTFERSVPGHPSVNRKSAYKRESSILLNSSYPNTSLENFLQSTEVPPEQALILSFRHETSNRVATTTGYRFYNTNAPEFPAISAQRTSSTLHASFRIQQSTQPTAESVNSSTVKIQPTTFGEAPSHRTPADPTPKWQEAEPLEDLDEEDTPATSYEDSIDPRYLKSEYKSMYGIGIAFASTPKEKLKNISHQFNDTVIECSFRGLDCKERHEEFWNSFWHYGYGSCFSFNAAQGSAPVRSSKPGPLEGLNVKLNADQDNYVDQLTQEAGFRILISPRGPMPFPFEEGISVAPGYSANIGVRKVKLNRVDPFKNRSCMPENDMNENYSLYDSVFNTTYSKKACKESCLAYHQLIACNCMEYRFPIRQGVKVCNVLKRTVVKCLNEVHKEFRENKLDCDEECPLPCKEEYFRLSTSISSWPSQNYESYLIRDLRKIAGMEKGTIKVRNNILRVRVFYEEFKYEEITESVSYELVDFVSDIGGQLGLWLGVSVLTGAEVIELLLLLFYQLFIPPKKPQQVEPENVDGQSSSSSPMDNSKFKNGKLRFSSSTAFGNGSQPSLQSDTKTKQFYRNTKRSTAFIDSVP